MLWVRLFLGLAPLLAAILAGSSLRGCQETGRQLKVAQAVAQRQQASDQVTIAAAGAAGRAQAVIRWRTKTIHDEGPVYVTAPADAQCVLPHGFVVLHDAAAAGVLPEPAAGADDAPAGLALSAVAATVADNYGACLGAFDRLSRLQGWIKAQQGTFGGK